MKAVLVCGGRDYTNVDKVFYVLDRIHAKEKIDYIIEGGAREADAYASAWANSRKVARVTVFADWEKHGKKAGYLRNIDMLTWNPDLVVAFPGGKITDMMCDIAQREGIEVRRIEDFA